MKLSKIKLISRFLDKSGYTPFLTQLIVKPSIEFIRNLYFKTQMGIKTTNQANV